MPRSGKGFDTAMRDLFTTMTPGDDIDKDEYRRREGQLHLRLLDIQKQLAASKKAALILMNGVEGSGKGETAKKMLEWFDARGVETTAFWTPDATEAEHPPLWRFWNKLPLAGRIGVFFGSWYTHPVIARVFRTMDRGEFENNLDDIRKFERMLVAEGVILIKLWMHLAPADQKRFLEKARSKAATKWRISRIAKKFFQKRKRFQKIDALTLAATHSSAAPWTVIDARHARFREIFAGETILKRLETALGAPSAEYAGVWQPSAVKYLASLDLGQKLEEAEYKEKLEKYTAKITTLTDKLSTKRHSLLLVFEGADAAGKGGAIRRVTYGIDPRHYRVNAVSAPTDVEKGHPYLWRFWQKIPAEGKVAIFDRSWYGRVLVERIEKFCTEAEWQRAFGEINDFEKALHDSQTVIRKFYLSISPEEQLKRFTDRKITPYKQYKLTEEDWRNRDKWGAYQAAADDMFANTSTDYAPWILVEANDKNHARIKVMKTVADALEEAVG